MLGTHRQSGFCFVGVGVCPLHLPKDTDTDNSHSPRRSASHSGSNLESATDSKKKQKKNNNNSSKQQQSAAAVLSNISTNNSLHSAHTRTPQTETNNNNSSQPLAGWLISMKKRTQQLHDDARKRKGSRFCPAAVASPKNYTTSDYSTYDIIPRNKRPKQ